MVWIKQKITYKFDGNKFIGVEIFSCRIKT